MLRGTPFFWWPRWSAGPRSPGRVFYGFPHIFRDQCSVWVSNAFAGVLQEWARKPQRADPLADVPDRIQIHLRVLSSWWHHLEKKLKSTKSYEIWGMGEVNRGH